MHDEPSSENGFLLGLVRLDDWCRESKPRNFLFSIPVMLVVYALGRDRQYVGMAVVLVLLLGLWLTTVFARRRLGRPVADRAR